MTVQDVETDTFAHDWQEWHNGHEARLADPHGFLAITNLHWLQETPERFPDAPGAWSTGPDGVHVTLAEGEELILDGTPLHGDHTFGPIPERASLYPKAGNASIEIAKRGGHDILRPRHPENPLRVAFTGTPTYTPDPRWSVTGRYIPFPEPRPTTVGAAVEGLHHVYDAPGRIEFDLAGEHLTLTVFNGHEPGTLTALFTDTTSGHTTYAANRSLHIPTPTPDGTVHLDFNRAANLPCAYTDLATCPLPPTENHLPVAIEAGQKTPLERA
ncbi:DUF1684 domain-containing protein [Catenulispora yoronensis]|uniref:DUF1684 domain-containing protein n=1 Tax=Catenulispora yoronensis TaxID=450799 RepID=A0ABP5F2Q2_9ACTN